MNISASQPEWLLLSAQGNWNISSFLGAESCLFLCLRKGKFKSLFAGQHSRTSLG